MINNKGFSLLELSIVLVILGFMTTASLTITKGILNQGKQKITKDRMYRIENAINSFLIKNGRLPCPAGIKKKYTTNSEIKESVSTDEMGCIVNDTSGIKLNANVYIGTIPADDLEIQKNEIADGWFNKYTYIVVKDFVKKDNYLQSPTKDKLINNKFVYAIISAGRNQYYSYDFSGNKELKSSIPNEKDKENSYNYITNNTINEGWGDTDFDDFVLLKSIDIIKQDLNIFDSVCKIDITDLDDEIDEKCGTEYTISTTSTQLNYGEKIYSDDIFEKKTITEDDGTSKEIKTKLKNCVIECSKYGRVIVYPHIWEL